MGSTPAAAAGYNAAACSSDFPVRVKSGSTRCVNDAGEQRMSGAGPGRGKAKVRVDVLLVERGLAETRSRAQSLILAGRVLSGEQRIDKSGTLLPADAPLSLKERERFVSRGGEKLEGALQALGVEVRGAVCADVGASTGGFTDCLLQRGAKRVFAIDVGHGQLAQQLRLDPRVVVLERTNARHLTREALGAPVDLVVVDVSFIGLAALLPAFCQLLEPGGLLLALVKPQFEAGRLEVARGKGVIRDEGVRQAAVARVAAAIAAAGFDLLGEADSVIAGPKGNRERFVLARLALVDPPPLSA
jgi:23S rRNA (cytidine1920-2'-O)/16S rRNA (cytidine1409-2'-O)-methyltransferase